MAWSSFVGRETPTFRTSQILRGIRFSWEDCDGRAVGTVGMHRATSSSQFTGVGRNARSGRPNFTSTFRPPSLEASERCKGLGKHNAAIMILNHGNYFGFRALHSIIDQQGFWALLKSKSPVPRTGMLPLFNHWVLMASEYFKPISSPVFCEGTHFGWFSILKPRKTEAMLRVP